MNYSAGLHPAIDLYVPERIAMEDAQRQQRTAGAILERLGEQSGVILADEVGMGKTFVALAVAASVALNDARRRPAVVMVPSSVIEKWPRDLSIFRDCCLTGNASQRLRGVTAKDSVELLRLLDEQPRRRCALIFLSHRAMHRRLRDPFVKLAIIRQALKWRRDIDQLQRGVERFAGDLLFMGKLEKHYPGLCKALLDRAPNHWHKVLARLPKDVMGDSVNPLDLANPVPGAILDELDELDTGPVFEALQAMPLRKNSSYRKRLKAARHEIEQALKEVWEEALRRIDVRMPLLIMDEAHHLKNAATRLASLFASGSDEEGVEELSGGALAGMFERMLFLTATPFQLGHNELCSVLERFRGIAWDSVHAPPGGRKLLDEQVETLRDCLDQAQKSATHLEQSWSRLTPEDLQVDNELYTTADAWWEAGQQSEGLTRPAQLVLERISIAARDLGAAEKVLRRWVIRHTRSRRLPAPFTDVPRRNRILGKGILVDYPEQQINGVDSGLSIDGNAALPFLLAARLVACTPESRPVFSEGLASSYEAFLDTRRTRTSEESPVDNEDTVPDLGTIDGATRWYLDQIASAVKPQNEGIAIDHPKLRATVQRAIALWERGEKVLIFCHYVATGRALREAVSMAIDDIVMSRAARQLGVSEEEVVDELKRISGRLDKGEPAARACREEVDKLIGNYPDLQSEAERLHDIVLRFLRRPSFIIRYFDLSDGTITPDEVRRAFQASDESGLSLRQVVDNFLRFLDKRCGSEDRKANLLAVEKIQTGTHFGTAAVDEDDDTHSRASFVGNVRLVNGATNHETRQRLMLTFNTPFYPEILIASSVMAEGVDLHLNCRHVIHHDLAWNPSNLEQRTGRIDRIGAKAEQAGKSIIIYMPYVAETQDEKMYRVVMDRESWFNVVMGGQVVSDARTAERIAERIPLPQAVVEKLSIDLSLNDG